MRRLLGLVALLAVATATSPFVDITSPAQVAGSGDNYPALLPAPSSASAFKGKRVLFVAGSGVEDHEVIYQHAYFVARGAEVTFACATGLGEQHKGKLIISDFFKPTYAVACVSTHRLQLAQFDAIFIPGGLPSSTAVRNDATFIKSLREWSGLDQQAATATATAASTATASRLLAIICSGNEALVELGVLPQLDRGVTGSPASSWTLANALKSLGLPADRWHGGDKNTVNAIAYPSTSPKRAHLVLGRNPDASPDFVLEIGKVWGVTTEQLPTKDSGTPLPAPYVHPAFHSLLAAPEQHRKHKPEQQAKVLAPTPGGGASSLDKKVAIVAGPAADYAQVRAVYDLFAASGAASVAFLCPSWVIPWKKAEIYLSSEVPNRIVSKVTCTQGFDKWKEQPEQYAAVVVAGGLFATNGVLRNDGEFLWALSQYVTKPNTLLGLLGSATAILQTTADGAQPLVPLTTAVPTDLPSLKADLVQAGFTKAKVHGAPVTVANVVVGAAGKQLRSFVDVFGAALRKK